MIGAFTDAQMAGLMRVIRDDARAEAILATACAHGVDSRQVLVELGIGQTEFDRLKDQGVVFSPS